MKDIAIYGAGGFGREIACLIQLINENVPTWNFIGFFDDGIEKGVMNKYGKILGGINDLNTWKKELAIAVAIGSPIILQKVVGNIKNRLIFFPNIIAPDMIFLDESSVKLGKGNIICSRSLISCQVEIGDFNLFNGYILVGHDTKIGSYNVFMPSINISGEVTIGDTNFMGVSSVILQQIKIGYGVRVGAGSVIMRKTENNELYVGNPAVKFRF